MPVLALEPFLHPEGLFCGDEAAFGGTTVGSWSVLHTRPRTEKSLARALHRNGVAYFLPLYERTQRMQRRLVRSYLPLFPGYVFLKGGDGAMTAAYETNLLVGAIRVVDQQRLESDLARIYDLMQSGVPLTPEDRLEPGMPAEITAGPLAGRRGRVLRRGGTMRLVIEVDFLQRGASVEVDASMVQAL